MRLSRCRIERWLSAMTARHSSTVTLASSSLPVLSRTSISRLRMLSSATCRSSILFGGAASAPPPARRLSVRICSSRATISRAQLRHVRIGGRQRVGRGARCMLRLALLARRQVGFEHRDLRVAARDARRAGSWLRRRGSQARSLAPSQRACLFARASATARASSRSSAAMRSARANNSSSSSGWSARCTPRRPRAVCSDSRCCGQLLAQLRGSRRWRARRRRCVRRRRCARVR